MAEQNPTQERSIIPGSPAGAAGAKAISRTRIVLKQSAVVDAATGLITINLGTVPTSCEWEIERVGIHCTAGVLVDFALYEDMASPLNRKDFTTTGNDNAADYNAPIWVASGRGVIAEWSSVPALDPFGIPCIGAINVQLVEVK